ncbi:MAG: MarR family winged helix-turn-helix transcriptional regulator [Halanaerobiaceae bacterium]
MEEEDLSTVVRNLLDIFPPLFKKTFKQGNFMKNSEITPVLFGIMNILYHEDKLTLTEISRRKAITSSNCSRAVNKLAELDYIKRETDKNDLRKTWISLTDKGQNYVEDIQQKFEEAIKNRLSELDKDDIQTLKQASEDLYNIMSKVI